MSSLNIHERPGVAACPMDCIWQEEAEKPQRSQDQGQGGIPTHGAQDGDMALNCKQGDLAAMWSELNAQWEPFRRGAGLYIVPKNARLGAIALPATAVFRHEPIERRKARTDV